MMKHNVIQNPTETLKHDFITQSAHNQDQDVEYDMNYMYEEDEWGSGDSEAVVVSPTIIVADNDENTTNSQADDDSNYIYDQVEDEDDAVVQVQPPLAMEFDTTMSGMMGALYEIQRRGDEMLTTISRQQKRLTALEDEVEIVEVRVFLILDAGWPVTN